MFLGRKKTRRHRNDNHICVHSPRPESGRKVNVFIEEFMRIGVLDVKYFPCGDEKKLG